MAARKHPKDIIATFKVVLSEAAKLYSIPNYKVTGAQFNYVAMGRLSTSILGRLGGFVALREYVSPSPTPKNNIKNQVAVIERIIKNAKAA